MHKIQSYDVVVVGSGGAGLRAAISSAEKGEKTLIVTRAHNANRSGATLLAGANISADIACNGSNLCELGISDENKEDTEEKWLDDLYREGFYLNNEKLLEEFVHTAKDRVKDLMDWGIKIRGMEGEREISVYGSDILDTLYRKVKELEVDILNNLILIDVVIENNVTAGIICADILSGELNFISAKAVVLATGGAHNVFSKNSGSTDLCGEGQAAAYRAGADLIDMEMISYCPTVTITPTIWKGNILPYVLFCNQYGKLVNKKGESFTSKYLPPVAEHLALTTEWNKMLLSYAIECEVKNAGGTIDGGVSYILDCNSKQVLQELYLEFPALSKGIYADMMKYFKDGKALSVQASPHYFEGGIRINHRMETTIPGLYAAGECTGGMFGANRVSAATTEMLVEGAIAGKQAAIFAKNNLQVNIKNSTLEKYEENAILPFKNETGLDVNQLKYALQRAMDVSMTVCRNEDALKQGLEKIEEIEMSLKDISISTPNRECNMEWIDYLELRSSCVVASAMLKSAIARKESRGVHVRTDYPFTDNDNFKVNIVVRDNSIEPLKVPLKNQFSDQLCGKIPYMDFVVETAKKLH